MFSIQTNRQVPVVADRAMGPLTLKVGSCPNDDNFVPIFICLFCVVFKNKFLSRICTCQENRKILIRIRVFSFVNFLCIGIPILKIVLSHTHK